MAVAQQETDDDVGNSLQQILAAGTVDMQLDDGIHVRVVFTWLPGRTVCTAARDEAGVLWIAMDDGKSWARGHAAEMLGGLLAEHLGPDVARLVLKADLRRIPTRGTRGQCRLALIR